MITRERRAREAAEQALAQERQRAEEECQRFEERIQEERQRDHARVEEERRRSEEDRNRLLAEIERLTRMGDSWQGG